VIFGTLHISNANNSSSNQPIGANFMSKYRTSFRI